MSFDIDAISVDFVNKVHYFSDRISEKGVAFGEYCKKCRDPNSDYAISFGLRHRFKGLAIHAELFEKLSYLEGCISSDPGDQTYYL